MATQGVEGQTPSLTLENPGVALVRAAFGASRGQPFDVPKPGLTIRSFSFGFEFFFELRIILLAPTFTARCGFYSKDLKLLRISFEQLDDSFSLGGFSNFAFDLFAFGISTSSLGRY